MKIKNYKKHSKEEYDLVMNLRKKYGWGRKRIFKYLLKNEGILIKKGTIDGWLNRGKRPYQEVKIKSILESSKELTKEKAYILGTLCGDGWTSTCYRIGLQVCDKEFADHFQHCLEIVYGVKCSIGIRKREDNGFINKPKDQYVVSLCSKLVIEDLQRYSKSFKSKEWKVPEQIKNVPKEMIAEFIKGFADSEGSARLRKGQSEITLCSSNIEGLKDLQKLLENIYKIRSYVKRRKKDIFDLRISNYDSLLKYYNEIGFIIKRKQNNLERMFETYKRKGLNKYSEEFKIKAMNLLKNGMKHRQIANLLGISHTNVYDWERKMEVK